MTNPKVFSAVNRAVVVTVFDAVWAAVEEAVGQAVWRAVYWAMGRAVYQAVEDPEQSSLQDFLREVHRAAE